MPPETQEQAEARLLTVIGAAQFQMLDGAYGWLVSHLKRTVGTGVIVICGRDRRGGAALYRASQGVFDYWGCPAQIGEAVIAEVRSLIERGRAARR
jgi:hypothetical protein